MFASPDRESLSLRGPFAPSGGRTPPLGTLRAHLKRACDDFVPKVVNRPAALAAPPRPAARGVAVPRGRTRLRAARRRRAAASRPRGSSCPRSRSRGGRCRAEAERGAGADDLLLRRPASPVRAELEPAPGPTGRATTRPSRGGTGATASGRPSRTAACRSRRRSAPRSARGPTASRPGAARTPTRRASRCSASRGARPRCRSSHASHSGCAATCSAGDAQLLRRVTVSQRPSWRYACSRPSRDELGERRRLVIADAREAARSPPARRRRCRS